MIYVKNRQDQNIFHHIHSISSYSGLPAYSLSESTEQKGLDNMLNKSTHMYIKKSSTYKNARSFLCLKN